ncbi:MAG TPA: hypothetical protein VIH91_08675 [Terriglobales bacterium]
MKKTVRNFVVLAVFAMALTGLSLAQDDTYRVNANVPFDFYAGDQQLPAGIYQFTVNYEDHSVMLRNKSTGRSYALLGRPGDGASAGEAVVEFDLVRDAHILADLKTASAGVGFPEEKSMLASAKRRGSVAIVASLR